MRRAPGTGNRVALGLWGLVLLVAASWVLGPPIATLMGGTAPASADKHWGAEGSSRVLDLPGKIAFEDWFAAAVIAFGVLLLVLAVVWLIRQLPRSSRASTLKLSDDVATGVTLMQPSVLERALKDMAEEHPAVQSAQVWMHGSATAPSLQLHVTAEPWAQLPPLSTALDERLRAALALSLGEETRDFSIDYSVSRKQQQAVHRGSAIDAKPKAGKA